MARLRKIINLVDRVSSVNYGIWHAAIATSAELKKEYGIESWLVSTSFEESFRPEEFPELQVFRANDSSKEEARAFFSGFDPSECVVASHGSWQFPTRWGSIAAKSGFSWVYTPHGMLEPWSMEQKAWKKIPYFFLAEKPMASKADLVRAVGRPEMANLVKQFPQTVHIPNGIYSEALSSAEPVNQGLDFLFLARLHFKKNLMPLVRAWAASEIIQQSGAVLRIAGTDDGEKANLLAFLEEHPESRIEFLGPVFGTEKTRQLKKSSFYLLPSLSEGFPTSVLEAAGAGLIPVISRGCNFPEIIEAGGAMESGTSQEEIKKALETAVSLPSAERGRMRQKAIEIISGGFLWEKIAGQQALNFQQLLDAKKI